jgi:tRNA-dihydrouridine synthase
MLEHYGPHGLYCFRKHLPFYIKGQAQASKLRSNLMIAESAYEIKAGLIEFLG